MKNSQYFFGIFSGITWALTSVSFDLFLFKTPISSNLVFLYTIICMFLYEGFATLWMILFLTTKKEIKIYSVFLTKESLYCVLAAIAGAFAMIFYLLSIRSIGSSNTVVITSSYPAIGVIFATIVLKEKLSPKNWIGVFICISGIILLNYEPYKTNPLPIIFTGFLYAIISAVGWASEGVISACGMKQKNISPEIALTIREFTSCIIYGILIIFLWRSRQATPLEYSIKPFCILFISLIGVTSFFAWYKSIALIGVSKSISLNVTYSFWTVVINTILLKNNFPIKSIVCSLLIIGGVIMSISKRRPTSVLNK